MKICYHYTLSTEDEVLESSLGKEPVTMNLESAPLHPILKSRLQQCKGAEVFTLRLDPSLAFGERRQDLVVQISRKKLPQHLQSISLGDSFEAKGPKHGELLLFRAVQCTEDFVVLDANSPLSGATVSWEVEVLWVKENSDHPIETGSEINP